MSKKKKSKVRPFEEIFIRVPVKLGLTESDEERGDILLYGFYNPSAPCLLDIETVHFGTTEYRGSVANFLVCLVGADEILRSVQAVLEESNAE